MRFKFLSKKGLKKLPKTSGVYSFKNKEILYIGKAANLRDRIRNHFQQPGFREQTFLNKSQRIGYIKTDSEIEALILEAKLIKKYQPKYNVMWRDDKNYFFAGKTKEDFPQIFITHQPTKVFGIKYKVSSRKRKNILNTKYFILNTNFVGPFVDGTALKQTLKILRKIFPYRTCKKLPKRPCLWYQLDRCPAPCILISGAGSQIPSAADKIKRESQSNTKNIFKILRGEKNKVLKDLKREMKLASKNQDFEKASTVRDRVFALERIISHSKILEEKAVTEEWDKTEKELRSLIGTNKKISEIEAYDVSNIQGKEATGAMITFSRGKPDKNFYRRFKIIISGKPNDVAMLKEVAKRRMTHKEWLYPDLVLVDGGLPQLSALKSVIKKIPIIAIAKKENKLFVKGKRQLFLKNLPRDIFNLILQLRDEAHRFAINYHKKLRKIKTFN